MIFPLMAFGLGMLFVLFYFMRKEVTYMNDGRPGSVWVALVIFATFALMGWWIDTYIGFSIIPSFMISTGGANALYAFFGLAGFVTLMIGMLIAQMKCGRMVA